jgi:hypothetical protein
LVVLPSLRRYSEPLAALRVGTPEPKKTPKLLVVVALNATLALPPAGVAVALALVKLLQEFDRKLMKRFQSIKL